MANQTGNKPSCVLAKLTMDIECIPYVTCIRIALFRQTLFYIKVNLSASLSDV